MSDPVNPQPTPGLMTRMANYLRRKKPTAEDIAKPIPEGLFPHQGLKDQRERQEKFDKQTDPRNNQ